MKGFIAAFVCVIILTFASCVGIGWVNNIVHICKADFEAPYKNEVLRCVGVPLAPLGVVLGWITFEEEK
jgi:hypothetical protein